MSGPVAPSTPMPDLDSAGGTGPERPLFRALTDALVAAGGIPIQITRFTALIALPDGSPALVLVAGDPVPLRKQVEGLRRQLKHPSFRVIAIGGDAATQDALLAARVGMPLLRKVQPFRIDLDGTLWSGPGARSGAVVRAALGHLGANVAVAPGWEERMRRALARKGDAARELNAFGQALARRRPVATLALLAAMAVAFAGELAWGGPGSIPTVVRMGAVLPGGELAGLQAEPWRLLAPAFLHGNWLHFLYNGALLWLLGSFVERLLGTRRMLVLFAASAAGGCLASSLLGDAVAVGSSGALWGLLTASGWLSLRRGGARDVLPEPLARRLRFTAGLTLLLSLVASFIPGVDIWAHLGGGVAGLVLAMTPWMLVEAIGRPAADKRPGLLLASVAALAMAGALVAGLVMGRPWELSDPQQWVGHELVDIGVSLQLPRCVGSVDATEDTGDAAFATFGLPVRDGAQVFLTRFALTRPVAGAEQRRAADELLADLESRLQHDGFARISEPVITRGDGHYTITEELLWQDPFFVWRASRIDRTSAWIVEVRADTQIHPEAAAWAPRVLDGIEPVASAD